ncbi:unnamed protein product [Trifolium pratense]|uniref:Uncharacterized protein n=1 Tax=Trifolium pratense TaxID=57577 RepID=A0ACB0M263_TRIPR|nr:unnamed protein product [Trifolium pratense]
MESFLCFLQIMFVVLIILSHHQACDATTNSNNQTYCPPSSCGKITNIIHPFRLKNDPTACGDPRYELSCKNNMTVLTLFSGKYYVQEIDYLNYKIRIVDPGIEEADCSSIPRYFLTTSNFTNDYIYNDYNGDPYQIDYDSSYGYIIYLKCSKEVKDDPGYVDTAPCRVNSDSKSYVYAFVGNYWERKESNKYLSVGRLKDYCKVNLVAMSSLLDIPNVSVRDDVPNRSLPYEQIHGMLLYGFQLSWLSGACRDSCGDNNRCYFNRTTADFECYESTDYCTYPLGIEVAKRCDKVSKQRILAEDVILGIVKGNTLQQRYL